ncbi:EAL domain-containing protein, partial [Sulfurimonas sp.]|nr:EAL domain-containing protein [Sulfurimonas sp.]
TGSLNFFNKPSTLFWNDPSLLNMFKPLVDELGKEMFCLQVAYSSSLGTDEDYNAMVTKFSDTFEEGFLNWGKAVSGAGWGVFELPYFNPENMKAKVIIRNPWELSMQKNLLGNEKWGCPFLQGKVIGIFNHAFDHTCWADETYFFEGDEVRVEFDIYSHRYTIQDKIELLRQFQEEEKVLKLKEHIQIATKEKDELLEKEKILKENLEESELEKRNILLTLPDMMWLKDIDGVYQSCNPEFERFFGAKESEIVGNTDYDFVDKELADFFRENDKKAMYAGQPTINEEWITYATDGRRVFLETTKTPLKNKHNEIIGVLGIGHDITQRHEDGIFTEKNSIILKMLATGEASSKIYDEIALMYEERHPGMRCSLLALEDGVLLHGGAPSMPQEYCNAVHGLKNGPTVGSCGASTYTGKRMLVENIDTHPNWADIKQFALPHGMRSCWSEPIKSSSGEVLGAFGMYYDYPALPDEKELKDLESAARLSGVVMERDKIQKDLESKERYQRALLDNFPFLVWLKDENSHFLAVNQPFADACNVLLADEITGKNDFDVWPKELAETYRVDDKEVILSGKPKNVEEELQNKDERIWIETYKSPVSLGANVIGTVGYARDITERKKDEDELKLAANVFTHTREGILITSIDNKILKVNDAVERITGYSKEELLGKNPGVLSSKEHPKSFYKAMWKELKNQGFWSGEISNRHKNGNIYYEMITITTIKDNEGNTINYVALFSDITFNKEQQKRLEYIAHYDALTNLPNRVLFSDRLHQAMAQTKRNNSNKLAVVYLDLDGFKQINDQHGHEYGDVLLSTIASRMKNIVRDEDTIARIGGDEFVTVLLNLEKEEECIPMLNRLLETASHQVIHNETAMNVSASIGVSFFDHEDSVDADQLVRYADQAMYQAKVSGKNRFHIFDFEKDQNVRLQHQEIENIKNALDKNEFVLYYQPKVNMKTGSIVGLEALIRWNHPEYGLILPGKFLPALYGHILNIEVGEWVLLEAVKHIEFCKAQGINLPISVNIDAVHLLQGNIVSYLKKLLKAYPSVSYHDLKLEILETSALEDITQVINIMKDCKNLGISFSLDDFGTGYSSLTYLKRLPVSELKIDRSFVHDMLIDTEDLAILEGIINLSKTFQRDVVAEGVESIQHGEILIQMGCEIAQGYAIARPMPMESIPDWIKNYKTDVKWANSHLENSDTTSVIYALIEHQSWMEKFLAFVENNSFEMIEGDYKTCQLNRWINIVKKHKKDSDFNMFAKVHQNLHEKANKVIQDKKQNSSYDKSDLEDVMLQHQKILDFLNDLR